MNVLPSSSPRPQAGPGCGNRLVRLRDLSFEDRRAGLEALLRGACGGLGMNDAARILHLVVDPGDASGRIEE
jgi:hypothetical protein